MNSRIVYVICSPLLTVAGAATTIIAPMLLNAASFTHFALLNSVFTYLSEFDLGLARLSDRLLPGQSNSTALASAGLLLFARYCVAIALLVTGTVCISDPLMLVASTGGIAMLLGNGPLSFYRARANITGLAFASLLLQFGLTLPRLLGLLLDGVRGSMIGLGIWTGISCIILNTPMIRTVRPHVTQLPKLIARSIPLFLYSALWLLYLFANRWVSWWVSDSATDAGLFAFGANLTVVGIGLVITISQPFYPRHLATPNPTALARELYLLLLMAAVGCVLGDLFCRYALGLVFPHFAESARVTSALLISAVPLGLSAWLVPLAIARSNHPNEAMIFPICLLLMYGLMAGLNACAGIVGQAWGCLPPAMIVFAAQLILVAQRGLLHRRDIVSIWLACLSVTTLAAVIWGLMLH